MKGPIQSVEVSYIVHATEDESKVGTAVDGLFSVKGEVAKKPLEDHHGNPIVSVKLRFIGADAASAFDDLLVKLSASAREEIAKGIEGMMDEHSSLYLRLDKQAIMTGKLVVGLADAVHFKVKPRLFAVRGRPLDMFLGLLGAGR